MSDQFSDNQMDPGAKSALIADDKSSTAHKGDGTTIPASQLTSINREFQEKSVLKHAHDLGLPYINIAKAPLNPDFLRLIPVEDAKKARAILFFKVGKKVRVAVDNPENADTKKIIEDLVARGFQPSINLASSTGIDEAMKFYDSTQKYKKKQIIETVEEKSIETYEKEIKQLADLPSQLQKVTAEESLNLCNVAAMKTKSSDVHYEPYENFVVVRFRIDGVLHEVFKIPTEIYTKISDQIKFQSKMRLNATNIPQDGRYVFNFNDKKIAVRVASIPTPYGESFVCRYLPTDVKFMTLEELGFMGASLEKLRKTTEIAQGMVLITGPTGSGKTTTLYSLLAKMNTPEDKIITLEDPVEYYLGGITQSQIDEKHGYDFANGLRSVLRHDPDIVMVGEIRDLETAEVVAQAALTGHVVLSTLHTNSAIESIPRLINMGLQAFMVAPALNTVVAQRLVRRVCSKCMTLEPIAESERAEYVKMGMTNVPEKLPKSHGCDVCSNTGYSGRLTIAEVVTITDPLKKLIMENASASDLLVAAKKEGLITIREDGFMKAAAGLTTLEEVCRVTDVVS